MNRDKNECLAEICAQLGRLTKELAEEDVALMQCLVRAQSLLRSKLDPKAFAAPSSQEVSAPPIEAQPTDAQWTQALEDRDRYHDTADELAAAIAKHLGVEIGDHSSDNCPWVNALQWMEAASARNEEQGWYAGSNPAPQGERAEFESWVMKSVYPGTGSEPLTRAADGYRHFYVNEQWNAWQARAAVAVAVPLVGAGQN